MRADYPEHEQLPAATMPDEFVGYVVQHRFRHGPNDWPLVQLGPGILSVNETTKYVWEDFRARAIAAVGALFDAHPKPSELRIDSLLLRYIDAKELDYSTEDVFAFLKNKMDVTISLPNRLFTGTQIKSIPQHLTWQTAFGCSNPTGSVVLGFATGLSDDHPSLIWETMVRSTGPEAPAMPTHFEGWLDAAHDITHDWFFKLIAGELEREFDNEEAGSVPKFNHDRSASPDLRR